MNKRITSIVLSLVMLFTMLATAVPVLAATPVALKVTADTTSAHPGDTINYKVFVGAVTNMGGLEFRLNIPSGLTIVDGSISIPTGLETTIDSDGAIVVPKSGNGYKWSYSAQMTGYTGSSDLVILNFACTVDDGASGDKIVTINVDTFFDNDPPYPELDYTVTPASVNVTAAPKPATGISLNKSTLELTVGESETLVVTVEPADTTDTVTWDTGRSDVATVDSTGKVTAVAPGTAVIAARAGEKSAFCTVTVVAAPCTHTNKTPVSAKSSTCKVQGWDAYSKCNDCGQLFDKDGNAISAIPYLPLAGHTPVQTATAEYLKSAATCTSPAVYYEHCSVCDVKLNTTFTSGSTVPHTESGWKSDANGHWKVCTVCGTTTTAKVAHTPDHTGHATEEYAIKCTECGYVIEAQLSHTHSLTPVAAKSATCTEDGNKAYYVCSGCSKWFEDATGSVEITDHSSVILTANGHTPSDWKFDADNHWKECTVVGCGVIIEDSNAAHTASDWIIDTAATATTGGTKHKECTECGYVLETGTIPATGYTITFDANGGSVTPASAVTGADGKLTSLPTPTRSGSYSFDGWYTAASGGTKVTTNTVFTKNRTVYAHWTYTGGGGSYYAPTVPDMPMLYRGCTGDAVKTLQEKLNAKGFDSGNADGIFGAKTYAAVTAFQKANSLGVDGIVGKLTWAKLYDATPVNVTPVTTQPMLRTGSRGDAVRKLQELLNAKGYTCGSVDGIFGSKTYAAVLAFQKANGLAADGIVGSLTWGKLV